MAAIRTDYGIGGQQITPGGSAGDPDLATVLREIADDFEGLQVATIATPDAGATYTSNEQALLNEIKDALNVLASYVRKHVKEG